MKYLIGRWHPRCGGATQRRRAQTPFSRYRGPADSEMTLLQRNALFTTSWDDGHPLDARLAELLSRHGFRGTFYAPLSNREGFPVMPAAEMQRLGQGFEIGSHTIDHCYLKTVNAAEARRQILGGKNQLEQILGRRVSGFCYPGGQYTSRLRQMVVDAGFDYARTTAIFHRALLADPFRMPTTIQFYPHDRAHPGSMLQSVRRVLIRKFLKVDDWKRTNDLFSIFQASGTFLSRMKAILDHVCISGGMFHLWGHSWELESFDGWRQLDDFLRYAAERIPAESRLSNIELVQVAAAK